MMESLQPNMFPKSTEMLQENFEWRVRHQTFLLITAVGIDPEKNNLTLLLGTGHDRDNIQAVRVWVRKELCCPSCAKTVKLADLYTRLQKILALDNSVKKSIRIICSDHVDSNSQ